MKLGTVEAWKAYSRDTSSEMIFASGLFFCKPLDFFRILWYDKYDTICMFVKGGFMAVCWFCKKNVGEDFESVTTGIKKTDKPICTTCAGHLKNIINRTGYDESLQYFKTYNDKMDNDAKKYINRIVVKKDVNIKSHGKMYYVDKLPVGSAHYGKSIVPVVFPKLCNCCVGETVNTEHIYAKDVEYIGNTKKIRKMHLEVPLCNHCSSTRKRPSVKITSYSIAFNTFGLLFTNKQYAELFAKMNNTSVSELEDQGSFSSMSWFGDEENIGKLIKWAIYIIIALLIIWRLG